MKTKPVLIILAIVVAVLFLAACNRTITLNSPAEVRLTATTAAEQVFNITLTIDRPWATPSTEAPPEATQPPVETPVPDTAAPEQPSEPAVPTAEPAQPTAEPVQPTATPEMPVAPPSEPVTATPVVTEPPVTEAPAPPTSEPAPVTPLATEPPATLEPLEPAQPAQPAALPEKVKLEKGEFPFCIARRYNVDPFEMMYLNNFYFGQIFYKGQNVHIPQSGNPFPGDPALRPHPATYIVQSGDTLGSVACYYGNVDPAAIAQLNGFDPSQALVVGQQLQIP
jgi:LysM repeat protein